MVTVLNIVYLMLIDLDSQTLTFSNTYEKRKLSITKSGFEERVIVT